MGALGQWFVQGPGGSGRGAPNLPFAREFENQQDLANCRIRISRMLIAFVGMKGCAPVALGSDEPRKFFEGPDFAVRISR